MSRSVQALACALCLAVGSASLAADRHAGIVTVIDGDTLDLHGTRIRLWGIDAPESRQLCQLDGKPWRCGQAAALALAERIGRQVVHCEQRDVDRWRRIIAICRVDGRDVGEWLVNSGLALAFRRYSRDYVDAEATARRARAGLWRGAFAPPWAYRRNRDAPLVTASAD
jgi:endonuclease YncB( thermonuclease family)